MHSNTLSRHVPRVLQSITTPSIDSGALILALVLGTLLRLGPALGATMPLNDGGLFFLMAQELMQAHFRLPAFTSYNGAHIPFTYPPFGLYLAAVLARYGTWSLLDIVRVVPALFSVATIPAFFLLCRVLLRSRTECGIAVVAFAVLPTSWEWYLRGGGITRAPGFFFALVALVALAHLVQQRSWRWLLVAMLCSSFTLLSHPNAALFLGSSSLLVAFVHGRTRRAWGDMAVVACGGILLAAPWWFTVLARHGVAPFVAASSISDRVSPLLTLLSFGFTGEVLVPLLAVTGVLGAIIAVRDRHWLFPLWVVSVCLLDPRYGATYGIVPCAMLIAVGLERMVIPAIRPADAHQLGRLPLYVLSGYAAAAIITAGVVYRSPGSLLQPITPDDQATLQWVATHTPGDARFLIWSGQDVGRDAVSEWFPALTARRSVATIQGTEWLNDQLFDARGQRYAQLQACTSLRCIERWEQSGDEVATHLYVQHTRALHPADVDDADDARAVFLDELRHAPQYQVVYDRPGGLILAKR